MRHRVSAPHATMQIVPPETTPSVPIATPIDRVASATRVLALHLPRVSRRCSKPNSPMISVTLAQEVRRSLKVMGDVVVLDRVAAKP